VPRRAAALICALAACLLATACGSGGGDGSGATGADASSEGPPIAKTAFVARANAICKKKIGAITSRELELFREGASGEGSRHEVETELVSTLLIPTIQDEITEFEALGAPRGDGAQIEAILAGMQEEVEKARSDPQSFVQAGGQYEFGHFGKAKKLAVEYGLTGCPLG
jgi:hypothetical protein